MAAPPITDHHRNDVTTGQWQFVGPWHRREVTVNISQLTWTDSGAGAGDGQSVGTSLFRPNIMEMFVSEVMFSSEVKSTVQ